MGPALETKFATENLEWAQHRPQNLPPKTLNGPTTIRCQKLSMGPAQFGAEHLEWAQHRKQNLLPKVLNGPQHRFKKLPPKTLNGPTTIRCQKLPMGPAPFGADHLEWAQHRKQNLLPKALNGPSTVWC